MNSLEGKVSDLHALFNDFPPQNFMRGKPKGITFIYSRKFLLLLVKSKNKDISEK